MSNSESSSVNKISSLPKNQTNKDLELKVHASTPFNISFPYAAQPDIVRANQKDVYYQRILEDQVSDIFRLFFGTRRQHLNKEEINLVSDLLYFCLTTLLGTQTLGEESCDIMQISETSKQVPSIKNRAILIFWHTVFPYLYTRGVIKLRRHSRPSQDNISDKLREFIHTLLAIIPSFLKNNIHALHLAIFYFYGAYYSLSKRAAGIRYIFTRQLNPGEQRIGYEVLGFLLIIQLFVQAYLQERRVKTASVENNGLNDYDENDENADNEPDFTLISLSDLTPQEIAARRCTLCLSQRKNTTATTCGHLFCWSCIIEWCQNKPECPLCRQYVNISHLLPIYNY
ncbi:Pex12 amino terminal region-domain-containing protein [Gigaspora rosea]|uniref:RING-type E3 ubiquitin transferase n=1 Tax=Gigaspora rosea TaxID=44941 RepID=A0A397VGR2_9GLOM|nr:Pex12 amino terminal region-domain-containing protein [Gigaspora rosea]